jgi:predicted transcriptional regulator YheO
MAKPKWIKVVEHNQKIKNVMMTAKKFSITRGTVYKYIERFKANKLKE